MGAVLGEIFSFFAFLLNGGQLFKSIICTLGANFFKSRPYFGRAMLSREATRQSQKLFPLVKNGKNIWGYTHVHCNTVITRVTGAIKSNRVISDTTL